MTAQNIETVWEAHLAGEFETEDLEATLATMVDDASVIHVPVQTGARGKEALRRFYGEVFIGSWPADLVTTLVSRTIGERSLVDEMRMVFTHSNRMEWFLPGVAPTGRKITLDVVAVISFRDGLARKRAHLLGPRRPAAGGLDQRRWMTGRKQTNRASRRLPVQRPGTSVP